MKTNIESAGKNMPTASDGGVPANFEYLAPILYPDSIYLD
jgi:hypothetical protein